MGSKGACVYWALEHVPGPTAVTPGEMDIDFRQQ